MKRNSLNHMITGAGLLLATIGAGASTVVVTNTANSGTGSLRQAINDAASGDTLDLSGLSGTILVTTPMATNKNLTLHGPGAGRLTISGGGISQIFVVGEGVGPGSTPRLALDGVTLANGFATAWGGAMDIGPTATVTIASCAFVNNTAWEGGAIWNVGGNVTVVNSAFLGNRGGEAAIHTFGPLTVANSTFVGNTTDTLNVPVAIALDYPGSANVTNCTFAGNVAGPYGSTIFNGGTTLTVTNCILRDQGAYEIDYLWPLHPTVTVSHSDVRGGWTGDGNIDSDPRFVRSPDPSTGDAGNLRLQPGSPCIDAGSNADISSPPFLANSAGIVLDLDRNARVTDGDGNGAALVDMGAYEVQTGIPLAAVDGSQSLIDAVRSLVQLGTMLPANGQALYAKLDSAIAALEAGDSATAIQKLQDFISQVKAFVKVGKLTSAQAKPLIDGATAVLHLLAP